MAASDIVIHKGEKEEKYQLYVEDYVMSYLKNYGAGESGRIFFYGRREQKNKKYYIYGAGCQRELSCFAQYEMLDEIVCRLTQEDMPVFLMKNEEETYELAGYYIFYQSNEAMQNYMVEQRKAAENAERSQNRTDSQTGKKKSETSKIIRPQNIMRPQKATGQQDSVRSQGVGKKDGVRLQSTESQKDIARQRISKYERAKTGNQAAGSSKSGIMTIQLAAIFVILIAIVINSTNSYTKLEDLNQAAVEVFFAMENKDASVNEEGADTAPQTADSADVETEGTVLRLADLDVKFEEENQIAKQEDEESGQTESTDETGIETGQSDDSVETGTEHQENDAASGNTSEKENTGSESEREEKDTEKENDASQESVATEEAVQSEQAFARNFAEYYKIEKGDTLYTISIKIYGDTGKVKEICELNKIKDPDNIKYGQKILLP